jgi:hypothetical protein
MTIESDVVDRQLAAYNQRDLKAFLAFYASAIRVYRLPNPEPEIVGLDQLASFYATQRFCLPGLRARVRNRMTLGSKVIDHELISGIRADAEVEFVAVYELRDGLIHTVWFHAPFDC